MTRKTKPRGLRLEPGRRPRRQPRPRRATPVIGCHVAGCHCVLIGGVAEAEVDMLKVFRVANARLRGAKRPRA
jgi:hypothetical protein